MTDQEIAELAQKKLEEKQGKTIVAKKEGEEENNDKSIVTSIIDQQQQLKKELQKILAIIKNKDKRAGSWVNHHFENPARDDGLQLHHWVKDAEQDDQFPFAKFNKRLMIIRYSEKEYAEAVQPKNICSVAWSKSDTDMVFGLCEQFQLNFINIADRFNFLKNLQAKEREGLKAKKLQQLQGIKQRDRKCKEKEAKQRIQ
mmetsp:Transcript_18675/g.31939  ORF Transcript_18675/g.31939 Transcript_18675/m.31939 type:complete len:200 (+) Transcript_18675:158-757(+)